MGEGIVAVLTMISSHTAFAYTAKAHFTGSKMYNGIVDTAATIGTTPGHLTDMFFIL